MRGGGTCVLPPGHLSALSPPTGGRAGLGHQWDTVETMEGTSEDKPLKTLWLWGSQAPRCK